MKRVMSSSSPESSLSLLVKRNHVELRHTRAPSEARVSKKIPQHPHTHTCLQQLAPRRNLLERAKRRNPRGNALYSSRRALRYASGRLQTLAQIGSEPMIYKWISPPDTCLRRVTDSSKTRTSASSRPLNSELLGLTRAMRTFVW